MPRRRCDAGDHQLENSVEEEEPIVLKCDSCNCEYFETMACMTCGACTYDMCSECVKALPPSGKRAAGSPAMWPSQFALHTKCNATSNAVAITVLSGECKPKVREEMNKIIAEYGLWWKLPTKKGDAPSAASPPSRPAPW